MYEAERSTPTQTKNQVQALEWIRQEESKSPLQSAHQHQLCIFPIFYCK